MGLPVYTSNPKSALSYLGHAAYQQFTQAITLTQVIQQDGRDAD